MAIKLPGVNYIPKVQQSSIKVDVTNTLGLTPPVLDETGNIITPSVESVSVNVALMIVNIKKATAATTITRIFSQINKMANGNQPETPPIHELILQGKLGKPAITSLEVSTDQSEEIPVCSNN